MRLLFSKTATRRLEEISTYIRLYNPTAATLVKNAIRDACTIVAEYSEAGRAIKPCLRRLVVPRVPYLIYYQVDERTDTVTIVTVRHSARRPLE